MAENSPIVLPEFKTVFDCEVYSIDFMTTDRLDANNFDSNVLRRGFLVLGRYTKPAVSEVSAYLEQATQQHLSSSVKSTFDAQFSPLIAGLSDQDIISLLKGDEEKVKAFASLPEETGKQYLEVHYFTVQAPLYLEQGKKVKDPEWYHDAFNDLELYQKGLQRWFRIKLGYSNLSEPEKVTQKIKHSSVADKEGTTYVMNNICRIFSPFSNFMKIKDITPKKIKEAALEALVNLQKENSGYAAFYNDSKGKIYLN